LKTLCQLETNILCISSFLIAQKVLNISLKIILYNIINNFRCTICTMLQILLTWFK